MEFQGIRPHGLRSLDDIFANDEMGLLSDVKAVNKAVNGKERLVSLYQEVADFFRRHHRLPDTAGSFEEKRLATKWLSALENADSKNILQECDSLGLLAQRPSETSAQETQVQSLDDIFANDSLGLLDTGNTDIFQIRHVHTHHGKPYADEDMAQRKPCKDFWRFEVWFKQIHQQLKNGSAHLERLKTETFLQPGDVFLVGGLLCYAAGYAETETRQSPRHNPRLRVIYENGTESDILTRSLARAVYKDENGKKVILQKHSQLPDIFTEPSEQQGLTTGYLYVLKLRQPKPELAHFKHLHKIGFTTGSIETRIADAENDIAFLESAVQPVLHFECRDINPHTFERLMHAFFAAQRLNLKLIGKNGRQYTPSEWFDVGLDVIEQAANLIVRGKINRYRMDNTAGKIKKK
ncbi:GIY-YIG nuclease family protein [Neisseria sp.]|uniref:GIY-YIG nuclease family protein n=1 Tax=Neisseria sp. TaxID=192066 RepID=UPI0026DD167A|nr:GIY-YIG nuclease family protein [Neisseria sp.]MDO4908035.1 GIY-YIG nuclease family protein [Neisseria sp.]